MPHKKGIPSQILANREESEEADALSSQTTDSAAPPKDDDDKPMSAMDVQKGLVDSSMRTFEDVKHHTHGTAGGGDTEMSTERKLRWAELLIKRPSTKDGDSMSNWLMEVLAVSDLDTPLVSGESDAPPKDDAALSSKAVMPGTFGAAGVIVKKKRGPDFLSKSSDEGGSGKHAGGSFAAWKERKKQKKLPYGNGESAPPDREEV